MDDILKTIRGDLRRSMNGIVSDSMRKKGVHWKLNFGVSLPKLKDLAATYPKEPELAELLWQQDVREMKILATLIYPPEKFTKDNAGKWANEILHAEIAEQAVTNLFCRLPFAPTLAAEWIKKQNGFQAMGFHLYTKLFKAGITPEETILIEFLDKARDMLDNGEPRQQRAALTALKRFGRISPLNAEKVLALLAGYPNSGSLEKAEFYEDLKFEFEYYR